MAITLTSKYEIRNEIILLPYKDRLIPTPLSLFQHLTLDTLIWALQDSDLTVTQIEEIKSLV